MKNELDHKEPDFTEGTEQVEAIVAQESALVSYVTKSRAPFKLDTLIPRNMAFEAQKSLNNLVLKHGNIDNYVRDHLKYASVEQLWKGLGAEQVDAVGLYLNQFEREQGLIIGDQTGIGKGRQAASVIRHAIVNGYLPVFFTRKPDLFSDMYRDLLAIGTSNINPFIVNTDSLAKVKDAKGTVVFSPLSSKEQYELINTERVIATDSEESINYHKKIGKPLPNLDEVPTITIVDTLDHLPAAYDVIFSTYSQIQSAHPFKRLWLDNLVNSGIEGSKKYKKVVFILDESHMAGGFDSIIGSWMREVLPFTKACCYLSATFAKYPEVMPFYAKKTAIQETGLNDQGFVAAMQRGGLALQEIVASNLSESGQLIRRQRSNEGIKVEYLVLDQEPERSKNRDRVNRVIRLMNEVVQFESTYIEPLLTKKHEEAKALGERLGSKPRGLGVKQSPYFSRVFNIIDQLLFSLKVEEVAKKTIDLLNQDKKVVIAFKSTMGAFLKDLNLVSGDVVNKDQLDFARTLIKGLHSVFKYSYTNIDGEKSRKQVALEELPQRGRDKYEELIIAMKLESTNLSISPIDQLIHLLESTTKYKSLGGHDGETFKVAEVTGRNQRINFKNGEALVQSFRSDTEKSFRLFNNGTYDVLLINQSGSTGSSAHASTAFKDQRQRAMIVHQFELDINTEIQKRGRINRTGQVVLPEYYYLTSDIPAESRLMTMLKAKLKSLDANTTGSQKTSDDTLKSADFLNKYGDKAAWVWVKENRDLVARMGYPTYHKVTDKKGTRRKRNDSMDGAIRQVTGRAGLLTVEEQDQVYNDLLTRYEHQIKWEKQRGTYDLETEFLKLDADVKKRFLFQKGKGGTTPFGKDSVREVSIVNNLKRPFTKDEVDERIVAALEGRKPVEVKNEWIKEINTNFPKLLEERKEKRLSTIKQYQEELDQLPALGSSEEEEENKKIRLKREKAEEQLQEKKNALNLYLVELERTQQQIIKNTSFFLIGDVVKIGTFYGERYAWGIYLGISVSRGSKNPYTLGNISVKFAVTDSRKIIEYNLTQEQSADISKIYTDSTDLKEEEIQQVSTGWNALVKKASAKREKRHLITENIVAAAETIGAYNKLIKYNTNQGSIKNGILMDRAYGMKGEDRYASLPVSEAFSLITKLAQDDFFDDHQYRIRFRKIANNHFKLAITKKGNFELITDKKLRALLLREEGKSKDELPDFVQNAGEMLGVVPLKNLKTCLLRLDHYGLSYLGHAKELEDWELENQQEWESKTKNKRSVFSYSLGRPYGQGSNPVAGFVSFSEPTPDHPLGTVVYDRKLTDKEKYNYSLIPIFKSVEESFHLWREAIENSPLKNEFIAKVHEVKELPFVEAATELGFFILNNPHEDGNAEFVFGKYSELEMGRVFYEEMIKELKGIELLIAQLQTELDEEF